MMRKMLIISSSAPSSLTDGPLITIVGNTGAENDLARRLAQQPVSSQA
jgi:hypothetical protein